MHNLAIVLKRKGHHVTGSDDKIVNPAKAALEREGIMPAEIGFYDANITADIDAIILGMHARLDNPELVKAQQLGLKIYSFPEYIYEVSKDKKRVVIGGSHGKTTVTSMVMHVLKECGLSFDYLVGAALKGFDTAVKITEDAPIIVLEGDEYLASPVEPESKFLFYKPHVALITGVAWDHINVFPVYENYVKQFAKFADSVMPGGYITWYEGDAELQKIFSAYKHNAINQSYNTAPNVVRDNVTYLTTPQGDIPLAVFGTHNLQNIAGAKNVCLQLGITEEQFNRAISTFEGAANRLQLLGKTDVSVAYKDFAHSPSKLKATVNAMKQQFPERQLVAVMELHTFSSLNKAFLSEYEGSMDMADVSVVFYDEETLAHKKMPPLDPAMVKDAFKNKHLHIFTQRNQLAEFLLKHSKPGNNLLLMTSGNFAGMDVEAVAKQFLAN